MTLVVPEAVSEAVCEARAFVRLAAALVSFFWLSHCAPGGEVGNGAIGIELDETDGVFAVRCVENRLLPGRPRFVQGDYSLPGVWRLVFASVETGQTESVSPSVLLNPPEVSSAPGEALLKWGDVDVLTGDGSLDVTVRISCSGEGGSSVWSVSVTNRNERWRLAETVFPVMARMVSPDDPEAKVLAPSLAPSGGRLYTAEEWRRFGEFRGSAFPGEVIGMCAVMRRGGGLCLAPVGEARIRLEGDCTFSAVAESGVQVEISAFAGDWWSAARLLRGRSSRRFSPASRTPCRFDVPLLAAADALAVGERAGWRVPPDCEYWDGFLPLAVSTLRGETPEVADGGHGDMKGIVRSMSAFRERHADWLVRGRLEDEVHFVGVAPDRIGGYIWRSAVTGRLAAFLYSVAGRSETVRFRFPGSVRVYECEIGCCCVKAIEEGVNR